MVVLSGAYMKGRSFCPASSSIFCWRVASDVCWRLIGIACASDLQAPAASVFSSWGVCVSSVVHTIKYCDAQLLVLLVDKPPLAEPTVLPELEHPASTSATALTPAARA